MRHLRQFVAFYSVRVRKRNAREDLDFSDLDGTKAGLPRLFDEVHQCLQKLQGAHRRDKENSTTTGVSNLTCQQNQRRIWGVVSHGKYGLSGTLLDTVTSSKKKIRRTHSPMFGYYFHLYLPTSGNRGLLALHSRGKSGCKTAFENAIREYLNRASPNLSISLRPVNLAFDDRGDFFNRFQVKKIRIVTFEPKNLVSRVRGNGGRPDEKVTVEKIIHVGRSKGSLIGFPAFARDPVRTSRAFFRRYIELPAAGDPAQFHVTVDMDGQEKTIRLDAEEPDFHISLDVTEDLPDEEQQDPSFRALHDICTPLIEDAIANVIGD
jgi:hypothetical protein